MVEEENCEVDSPGFFSIKTRWSNVQECSITALSFKALLLDCLLFSLFFYIVKKFSALYVLNLEQSAKIILCAQNER